MSAVPSSSLRAALVLALSVARDGERRDPPSAAPGRLRPYLGFAKVPPAALELCRRVLDEDHEFRRRVAAEATVDGVGALGFLWLTRPDRWEVTAAELQAEAERRLAEGAATRRLDELAQREAAARHTAQQAESARRQLAARLEEALAATNDLRHQLREGAAELEEARTALAQSEHRGQELLRRLKATEAQLAERGTANRQLRAELDRLRRTQPSDAVATRAGQGAGNEPESRPGTDTAIGIEPAAAGTPHGQEDDRSARDAALHRAVATASAAAAELARALAEAAGALGDALPGPTASATASPGATASPTSTTPASRLTRHRPLPTPPGLFADGVEAAEHLVRVPGLVLLVDGYNVAKQGWPDLALALQRQRLVDALVALRARTRVEATVVFDGSDDAALAARTAPERLRVEFTPSHLEADDRLLDLVEQLRAHRPVAVATNDRRVRDGARDRGANTIAAEQLLAMLR